MLWLLKLYPWADYIMIKSPFFLLTVIDYEEN
jgi:hypothetical protein